MNTHKTISKQREKILLGGVAATALGLINAKPQMVKAANQNGTRATKKATKRTVKTILNYQTETSSETEGATATDDDPTDQNSDNQTNVNISNSNPASLQTQGYTVPTTNTENNSSLDYDSKTNTNQFDPTKATRDSNSSVSSTWNDIPVTFSNGVLSIGEKNGNYKIDNTENKDISIFNNISNVSGTDITEIDINAPIAIIGSAEILFYRLLNLTTINGLNKLDTSKVTNMKQMFMSCTKMTSLDLSSFDTTNVTSFNTMFASDPNLTSVDLSSFTVSDNATTMGMFALSKQLTSSLSKLILGKGFKFTTSNDRPNNSLQQPGTWINMGEDNGSLTKGTNQWSSADLMTNYQGDRDHDTYVRYTGGTVTVHRQDEDGKQLVDQDGKQIPDEKLFGNISDPVTVDTSKEIAGYTFKENKNSDVKAFTSDPQDITLVYSKSKTDNTNDNTWEGVPYTFNNGVLSLGEKGKTYTINNSDNKDISIKNNISNVAGTDITEIDINAPIAIIGSAQSLFSYLNFTKINGLDKLDTSKVTNMSNMFFDSPKIVSLDLSSFDTANVTNFNMMFVADRSLESVDLSSFSIKDNATTQVMFKLCENLKKLILGKGFKFTISNDKPNNSLQQPGTWVNMGVDQDSPAKGTNKWTSDELMTNYQGDRDHDTYVRYTGGTVTIHRQDEDGKQLVDQDGKQIPDEKLFGNISDPVTVDTSKEFAGYTFKENKNSDVKAFTSDPQDITLVYSKSKTDNTSDNTWEGVPYTFNNGVLSLGEKGKNYAVDNSGNKEKSYALDTRDISISQNIKGVNVDEIKEIDLNAPIAIKGSANGVFKNLKNLATIKGLDNLDTSQVTDFSLMFSGDTALTSADLSNFQVAANAEMTDMFSSCSSLTKLTLGTGFKFIGSTGLNDLSGTWVNMGAGEGSPAKGTNKWTSAELVTNYQGDTNHDVYVRFTNLGGKITINYRDQDDKEIPGVPAEVNFGNENDKLINDDPVTTFKLKDPLKDSSGTEYQFDHAKQNNSRITLSDVTYSASANPQDITLVYTKKTGTGSNGSGSNGSGSNNGSGNSTPNSSVPNNNNSSSGNNGSVNNPSSSNSQGSNSQGSNTGNSNNNSSSASNGQNNGNNLPNNEPNNIPTPVNRKPKTVKPHKTINKGFNIKDQNAIHNQQLANSLKNNGSSSNAQNNASNTLPQTGNDKHSSLAMLALGSLALATALGAAWFGRKKD
ncbi:BspA family leucine-rich repeat surface protein [Lactobacillus melliventris]|uniref:BspA family leucine-rich repeat surface protein n=1 Tax=Lactobacillus melliventris TaxID=1218507 RepID=UPI0015811981|nr:BspA family leucine-rich repeat surface protein [Lactobacillus melliventris]NUE97681.1 BspA family leucine-rich repeat surface protein [Lactobacillus melliventris]